MTKGKWLAYPCGDLVERFAVEWLIKRFSDVVAASVPPININPRRSIERPLSELKRNQELWLVSPQWYERWTRFVVGDTSEPPGGIRLDGLYVRSDGGGGWILDPNATEWDVVRRQLSLQDNDAVGADLGQQAGQQEPNDDDEEDEDEDEDAEDSGSESDLIRLDRFRKPSLPAHQIPVTTEATMKVHFVGKRPPTESGAPNPPTAASSARYRMSVFASHLSPVSASKEDARAAQTEAEDKRPGILIANRGEIAIRIADAASSLGFRTISIFSKDDDRSLHTKKTDVSVALPASGPAAYLDVDSLIRVAKESNAVAIHPGYGFVAESEDFARRCAESGLVFVGPAPEVLEVFGDKAKARTVAQKSKTPTVPGTLRATSLAEAESFARTIFVSPEFKSGVFGGVIVKALFGGGGRGMRVVSSLDQLPDAFARCKGEAKSAFGRDEVYVEALLAKARHIEVQIVSPRNPTPENPPLYLHTRDCTLQRRHQKVVEIAPAPKLHPEITRKLGEASVRMALEVGYSGLGTWEFLVVGGEKADAAWFFIEANPRVQVEHTVTEEILGVDLVAAQIEIALHNKRLADTVLGFGLQQHVPQPQGWAVQLRVNCGYIGVHRWKRLKRFKVLKLGCRLQEGLHAGVVSAFEPPSGRGIRVDHCGYPGYQTNANFDPLLAKVIVSSPRGTLFDVFRRCGRALDEFKITGVETTISFLQAVLVETDVVQMGDSKSGKVEVYTRWIDDRLNTLSAKAGWGESSATSSGSSRKALFFAADQAVSSLAPTAQAVHIQGPPGTVPVVAPMQSTIVSVDVKVGDYVKKGQQVAVLNAMKMEHVAFADSAGIVRLIVGEPNVTLPKSAPILFIEPASTSTTDETSISDASTVDVDRIRPDLAEAMRRHFLTSDESRPEAVARRRKLNKRTARENVGDLCDEGTFFEWGGLVIAAQKARRSMDELIKQTPADGMIVGIGHVNGNLFDELRSRVMVFAYDYTVLAGTQGVFNHKKKDRMFQLAFEHRLPVVFYCEGGGGRPGDTEGLSNSGGLDIMTFRHFGKLSGLVPMIGITTGYCFAGNAALLGTCDVIIATEDSNIGLGGPAMIEGGGLGVFKPKEVGPVQVQNYNGVIDVLVKDEVEATRVAKKYLSYFQGPIREWRCADQRLLRASIPENRLRSYDVRQVMQLLFDQDSILELRAQWAIGIITAFARVEGRAVGVIANNCTHLGGAIDAEAGDKAARFMQLCDAYDIPIVSLCDTPGFMVGPDHEKTAIVRHVARMFVVAGSLTIPFFTIVLRKGYGLGAQASEPTGEFGGMGLEGAVRLAYRNELAAIKDPKERLAAENAAIAQLYESGKALKAAESLDIDNVIDPAASRRWIMAGLKASVGGKGYVPVEQERGDALSLNVLPDRQTLQFTATGEQAGRSKPLTFNAVFDDSLPQEAFFSSSGIMDLVDRALEGYYTTVFAYGQTGSGKTYTMTGPEGSTKGTANRQGIVPRALSYLFSQIASRLPPETNGMDGASSSYDAIRMSQPATYTVRASYLEIYNEVAHDLLTSSLQTLPVRYKPNLGFYVENLFIVECEVLDDAIAVLEEGLRNRTVGSHKMNERSSRSHAVMTVHVDSYDPTFGVTRSGKISFVDLAGSERVSDTDSTGTTFNEALSINKSLLTLGNCISALSDPKRRKNGHVPYRDSKLTKLLMDSLGGNGFALMIACVSPSSQQLTETIKTLRYASRAKRIRNRPVIVMDPREELILCLRKRVGELEEENRHLRNAAGFTEESGGVRDGGFLPPLPGQATSNHADIEQVRGLLQQYMAENDNLKCENNELVTSRMRSEYSFASLAKDHDRLGTLVGEYERILSANGLGRLVVKHEGAHVRALLDGGVGDFSGLGRAEDRRSQLSAEQTPNAANASQSRNLPSGNPVTPQTQRLGAPRPATQESVLNDKLKQELIDLDRKISTEAQGVSKLGSGGPAAGKAKKAKGKY
ncbi:hypothetical protein HDU93_004848 [Gonapodya sp. JEL0774]|nr:hypothetical protein HDU93_004848 [Gonapodya sp. JEL0774]